MLLELMLEVHAWSTARPAHESDATADTLEKEVKVVIGLEKEQGTSSFIGRPVFPTSSRVHPPRLSKCGGYMLMSCRREEKTRQRLNDFVTRIKLALAALTDLSG